LSGNPTYRDLAQSVSKNESGLEYEEAEQPVPKEGSEIKDSL